MDDIIAEIETDNPRFASMLRALSRMTLTPTMVRGGIKSNSVPESIRLTCDVRTLPHQDDDYVRQQLDEVLADVPGVSYEIDYMARPNSSPFESPLSDSIRRVTGQALQRDNIQMGSGDQQRVYRLAVHPAPGHGDLRLLRLPPGRRSDAQLHPRDQRIGGHQEPGERHQDHAGLGVRHAGGEIAWGTTTCG